MSAEPIYIMSKRFDMMLESCRRCPPRGVRVIDELLSAGFDTLPRKTDFGNYSINLMSDCQ